MDLKKLTAAFPDYPVEDVPADIPKGFADESWTNDLCPSFGHPDLGVTLYIDYLDPAKREHDGGERYGVIDDESSETLLSTGDWFVMRSFLVARMAAGK
jgi:hypothetical protein